MNEYLVRCAHRDTGAEYEILMRAATPEAAVDAAATQGHLAASARPLAAPPAAGSAGADDIADAIVRRIGEDEYFWRRLANLPDATGDNLLTELRAIRRSWIIRFPTRVIASGVWLALLVWILFWLAMVVAGAGLLHHLGSR